ncbi:DUF1566 domain-containing protein [Aliivibrio fischeri]|uniref:Lipoprotein, putative n=1 Tax=Aliivibrio fischeri (strain MJ11) TaxID=388396 RepID=B5ETA5_ALIFM|nr:DUF1566 domain-containing protein [Aliivibrio fischeri]ACH64355.1 lipoprotein, putative [Aliivibrio fischeri MJ11]MUL17996.1 DUF1566 domain-containing protein [Aliivibrio fischeri]
MKYQLTLLATTLALTGCGGSDSPNTSVPSYTLSGTIATQHIAPNSKVCVDINQNLMCDANEPTSKADAQGKFSITDTNKNIVTLPLLAETPSAFQSVNSYADNAIAASTNNAYIVAPGLQKSTGNKINGITSLIAGHMNNGMTAKKAIEIITTQLSEKGISLRGNLLDNLQDPDLAILEQNVITLLKHTKSQNRTQLLTLLSANIINNPVDMVTSVLTEAQSLTFIKELNAISLSGSPLNDTGTVLYFTDENSEHNVETSPLSFPGQDADFGFDKIERNPKQNNGFKFTKLDMNGNKLGDSASRWRCVLDERSGLIWEIKSANESSIQFKNRQLALELADVTPFSKDEALATCKTAGDEICTTKDYVNYINSIQLCGKSDWRLPRFHEIYNLIDFGERQTNSSSATYGLSHYFFPNQPIGSSDIEEGGVWHQTMTYGTYTPYNNDGALSFNTINLLGENKGSVSTVEVYTSKTPPKFKNTEYENDPSYLFPARLVSAQGN